VSPRTVFSPYARLFAVPGARAFSLAGWFARVPMATVGLGSVLLVEGETGSYGLAGAIAGTLSLSFALASPQWARAMDRIGQGPVLRATALTFLVFGLAFVAVVLADGPRWSWFVLAALAGASGANVGSVVRSRWANALPDQAQRQTAFAFESVADEVVFVVAPPLVTFLAALIAPPAGFLTGLLTGVVGGLVLSRLQATAPPVAPRVAGQRPVRARVLAPWLVAIAVTYLAMGAVFGAMDVVVVGFADEQGRPVVRRGCPVAAPDRFAADPGRVRLRRRAQHRARAGRRDVARRVAGAPGRADRGAHLDLDRPDRGRHGRLRAGRCRGRPLGR
jgi:MFS family permease